MEKLKSITKSLGGKEHPAYNNMSSWTGHILCRNCLLKHLTEGTIEGMGRQGRCTQLNMAFKTDMLKIGRGSTTLLSLKKLLWKRVEPVIRQTMC